MPAPSVPLPPAGESPDGHVLYRHIAGLIRREIEEGRYRPATASTRSRR
jgi:hypothetical protein